MNYLFARPGAASFVLWSLGLVFVYSLAAETLAPPTADESLPPAPDAKAEEAARARVAGVYREKYAKAKTAAAKTQLAHELIKDSIATKEDLNAKYALLVVAKNIALDADDLETALAAVNHINMSFAVDRMAMVEEAVDKTSGATAQLGANTKRTIAILLELAHEALMNDRIDLGEKFTKSAQLLARRAGEGALVLELQGRIAGYVAIRARYETVKTSLAALRDDPNNKDASLAVGQFRCLAQERWEEGLPLLAAGSDEKFSAAAHHELDMPDKPDEFLALGDEWWALSDTNKPYENELRTRAVNWYLRAYPTLDGFDKRRVEMRIASTEKWLSKDATYMVSEVDRSRPPLASLVTTSEIYHKDGGSEFAFQIGRTDAFITIDLKREVFVTRVYVQNRPVKDRARGIQMFFSRVPTERGQLIWTAPDNASEWNIILPQLVKTRYVTIARDPNVGNQDAWLHLRKVKVFGP